MRATGDANFEVPDAALFRAACAFMLGHMNAESIEEAYKVLLQIYNWQQVPIEPARDRCLHRKVVAPKIRRRAARNLAFDD